MSSTIMDHILLYSPPHSYSTKDMQTPSIVLVGLFFLYMPIQFIVISLQHFIEEAIRIPTA